MLLTRFEPTYKELKHANIIADIDHERSFEPTYKELKHAKEKTGRVDRKTVLSLPIRN